MCTKTNPDPELWVCLLQTDTHATILAGYATARIVRYDNKVHIHKHDRLVMAASASN